MKRKTKSFILGLLISSSLLLSSCGLNGGPTDPSGEGGDPGTVIPEPTDIPEDIPEPTETDITPEKGLSQETKQAIANALDFFHSSITNEEFEQLVIEYATENKVDENVIKGLLKIATEVYKNFESSGMYSSLEYLDVTFELAKEIRIADLYRHELYFLNLLLNGRDFEFRSLDYYNYRINGVSRADLKKYEKIAAASNDQGFVATVNEYKDKFDNLYIDPSSGYTKEFSVPDGVLDIFEKFSVTDQLAMVRIWEQFVAYFGLEKIEQIVSSISELNRGSSSYYSNVIARLSVNEGNYNYYLSKASGTDPQPSLPKIVELLSLQDIKMVTAILLKDEKNAESITSIAANFVIPLFAFIENQLTPETSESFKNFLDSLRALKANNITVVGRLLSSVLSLFTESEFASIKTHIKERNFEAIISLLLQKKEDVAYLINSLSNTDINSLNGLSAFLGTDLYAFLRVVANNVVNIVSLENEASEIAINNITEAASLLARQVSENLGSVFNSNTSDYYFSVNYNYSTILETHVDATHEEIETALQTYTVYFNISRYDSPYSTSFYYGNAPSGYNVTFEADTSKAGVSSIKFIISFQDVTLSTNIPFLVYEELSDELLVSDGLLDTIHTVDDFTMFSSSFSKYVKSEQTYVGFDASTRVKGWNIIKSSYTNKDGQTKTVYAPYFYIGDDDINDYVTVTTECHFATFVSENANTIGNRYLYHTKAYKNMTLYVNEEFTYLDENLYDTSALSDVKTTYSEVGDYKISKNDIDYYFHVFDKENVNLNQESFEIDIAMGEEDESYFAESVSCKRTAIYAKYVQFLVSARVYNMPIYYEEVNNVTVTNLTYYSTGSLSFDYSGYTYYNNY